MNKHSVRGFTMLEIMIALFIFAVGVLGAGALQLSSLNNNKNNLFRTQAIMLAEEIIDQMRANPTAAKDGSAFNTNFNTSQAPSSKPNCADNTGCSDSDIAKLALFNWKKSLEALPNGEGEVTRDTASNSFTVRVSWKEKNTTTNNTATTSYSVVITL